MTEASAPKSSCKSMNMEGVEESPVKMTPPPQERIALVAAEAMRPAERRESCPIAMVGAVTPVLPFTHV